MRNEVQFQSKPDIQKVVLKFESMVEKFGSLTKGKLHGSKPKVLILWKPLNHGTIAINVDASVGNGTFFCLGNGWSGFYRDSHFLCLSVGDGVDPSYS